MHTLTDEDTSLQHVKGHESEQQLPHAIIRHVKSERLETSKRSGLDITKHVANTCFSCLSIKKVFQIQMEDGASFIRYFIPF